MFSQLVAITISTEFDSLGVTQIKRVRVSDFGVIPTGSARTPVCFIPPVVSMYAQMIAKV